MNIFRRFFIKCFYCSKKVDKNKSFEVKYTAADGSGKVVICPECATHLDILAERDENQYD